MPYLIQNPEAPNKEVHELKVGSNTIGRELDNSIVVIHISLSRHHAKVTVTDDQVLLTDLGSLNHTFVNETKIDQWELKDADLVRCGSIVFQFVQELEISAQEPLRDEDVNLSIVSRIAPEQTRVVLQDLLQGSSENQGSALKLRQQEVGQRAIDKLKILLEVSKQLSSPEEPDRIIEKILDLLFKIMNVDRAVMLLVNEETGQLEDKIAKFQPGIPTDEKFYSTTITNFVHKNGEAILIADARYDQRFHDSLSILKQAIHASMCVPLKPRDKVIGVLYTDSLSMANVYSEEDLEFLTSLVNQAIHASMCVPLKPRDKVIGVLYTDSLSMANVYSEEDLEFLTSLVNQAAIAIENAQLNKKIQTAAIMQAKLERFFPQAVSKKLKEDGNLEIVDTEVTALFADISSFTEMSSRMEPRQVIEMLNEYFQVMVEEIVFQFEGTLEKYIGDALLAIWGAPYQQTDDAQRAVSAAIAMQRAVCRLNEQWVERRNLQIQIHIGLNTGKVAAGNIGSQKLIQYATIGDATNVTSRICSAAKPGEILISQSTLDKLNAGTLPLEKIPPVMVKGKDQPLQLYRVLWDF